MDSYVYYFSYVWIRVLKTEAAVNLLVPVWSLKFRDSVFEFRAKYRCMNFESFPGKMDSTIGTKVLCVQNSILNWSKPLSLMSESEEERLRVNQNCNL